MKIFPVFLPHKGCPFSCIYCDQFRITQTDHFDRDKISENIRQFYRNNSDRQKEVAFFGGTFSNLSIQEQKDLFELAGPFPDNLSGIRFSTRPDSIEAENIPFYCENGVSTIELGIQSFSDKVLNASRRGYGSKIALESCRMIKAANISLGIQLMPGLPEFSEKTLARTLETTISLQPDFVRIYPTIVLKNTALERLFRQRKYSPLKLETAIEITGRMVSEFQKRKIEVIKIGLHSDIAPEFVIAGPYHESFGELVRAEMLIDDIVQNYQRDKTLCLSQRAVSLLKGHNAVSLKKLKIRLKLKQLPIKLDADLKIERFAFRDEKARQVW